MSLEKGKNCRGSVPVAVVSVERTVPRQCKLDCRGLVRVAVVSVERTIPRQIFLTTSVAENQLSRYSPCRGTVRLPVSAKIGFSRFSLR